MSRDAFIVIAAIVASVVIPTVMIAIPLLVQRIPLSVGWLIVDFTLFIPMVFLWGFLFVLFPGLTLPSDVRELWRTMRQRHERPSGIS